VLPLRPFSYLANDDDKPLETETLTKKKNPIWNLLPFLFFIIILPGLQPTGAL
jgi:hypothetical protein